MNLRSPLSNAIGLGSARHGLAHWWWQRLSAVALIPLSAWFVWSVVFLVGADYQVAVDWLQSPVQASLLLLFILVSLFHAQTGIQVVIEDYVHTGWLNMTIILWCKGASLVMAAVALVSILQIYVGRGR